MAAPGLAAAAAGLAAPLAGLALATAAGLALAPGLAPAAGLAAAGLAAAELTVAGAIVAGPIAAGVDDALGAGEHAATSTSAAAAKNNRSLPLACRSDRLRPDLLSAPLPLIANSPELVRHYRRRYPTSQVPAFAESSMAS